MAGNSAEMKVKATMDNSDLKKKAKESKDALKDFAKVGEDAVSSLGSAFGVNTGKIKQMISAVRGLGENLSNSGNAGTAALGNLLEGVKGLTAGIAGIGIGAAVAGFKMLKDEAENFKQTVAGANIELATTAYIDTYRQILHDFNSETGRGVAEITATLQKGWAKFRADLKQNVFNMDIGTALVGPIGYTLFGGGNKEAISAATKGAEIAERLAGRIFELQRKISDKTVEWARQEREIAEYKRIAYDTSVDTATRQEALRKSIELINERYSEEAKLRKQIADLQFQYNDLASSSIDDIDKANRLRVEEEAVVARMNDKLRELLEKQATLTKQAQEEAKARADAAEAAAKMAQSRADLQAWRDQATITTPLALPTQAVALKTPGLAVRLTPEIDPQEWTATAEQLNMMLGGLIDSMSSSLGGLVADLINGENAWENFGAGALSALGDLAISFGKICVASGLASEGIKKSLALHPVLALTAGAALIALGTAVKTSLSNIASGNYSASSSVATSTGSYGSSYSGVGTSFDTRDITVNVRGSLRADGNQLLAVIENENTRRNHTT